MAEQLTMHLSTKRLFDYAKEATKEKARAVKTFGDLSALMGVTSATMTNWKQRGVSKDGAIKAEAVFGCSTQWVLVGEAVKGADEHTLQPSAKLPLFRDLTAFEAQYLTPFRHLSNNDQRDDLVRLNQRVDRAAMPTTDKTQWATRLERRQSDRRGDLPNSPLDAKKWA